MTPPEGPIRPEARAASEPFPPLSPHPQVRLKARSHPKSLSGRLVFLDVTVRDLVIRPSVRMSYSRVQSESKAQPRLRPDLAPLDGECRARRNASRMCRDLRADEVPARSARTFPYLLPRVGHGGPSGMLDGHRSPAIRSPYPIARRPSGLRGADGLDGDARGYGHCAGVVDGRGALRCGGKRSRGGPTRRSGGCAAVCPVSRNRIATAGRSSRTTDRSPAIARGSRPSSGRRERLRAAELAVGSSGA